VHSLRGERVLLDFDLQPYTTNGFKRSMTSNSGSCSTRSSVSSAKAPHARPC